MAFLDISINVNDLPVGELQDFSPLPAGDYVATIKSAEIKPTSTPGGQYIAITFVIAEGSHVKRLLWANVNIKNQSSAAETIGRQQLGDIMRAIQLAELSDTDQLVGATLSIKVASVVERKNANGSYKAKGEANYDSDVINPKNEVKGYKAAGNVAAVSKAVIFGKPAASTAAATQTPAAETTAKKAAPWAK